MKRKFKSVRPKIDVTNQCYRCKKFYNDKDVAILEEGVVCMNCLDTNNPEDVNKMLKVGFQQEDIMTIRHIQYGIKNNNIKNNNIKNKIKKREN